MGESSTNSKPYLDLENETLFYMFPRHIQTYPKPCTTESIQLKEKCMIALEL